LQQPRLATQQSLLTLRIHFKLKHASMLCACCLPHLQELMGSGSIAVGTSRRALAGCSDLERCLARLAASVGKAGSGSGPGGFGREAAHVVLYEDMAKRRVKVLVGAMRDLQALREALQAFGEVRGSVAFPHVTPGNMSDMFQHVSVESTGRRAFRVGELRRAAVAVAGSVRSLCCWCSCIGADVVLLAECLEAWRSCAQMLVYT
jgi:hypothetical protein